MKIIQTPTHTEATIFLTDTIENLPVEIQKISKKYFDKNQDVVVFIPTPDKNYLLSLVLEKNEDADKNAEQLRVLGHQTLQILHKEELFTTELSTDFSQQKVLTFLEGIGLSEYSFGKYKTQNKEKKSEILIGVKDIETDKITELQQLITSVNIARDLVNEPVSFLTATQLSQEIQQLGKTFGFSVEVLTKQQIQDLGMGGLLGVNQGSEVPPTFNILSWKPSETKNTKPYVLVGKGVVYDTGGYNVKPGAYMDQMKSDMAGAAAVIGTMCAVAQNKLPLHVIGLIPATDNRINSNAIVSDDILTMLNGLTVEVKNTDAEGRLILADALAYADRYQPELVIDLATLTGAAARVTSHYGSAMMGTACQEVKNLLKNTGDQVYERLIEFPFWDEFDEDIKSPIADVKNLGGAEGGASTAGKFLQKFTSYPWIHLDIAGTAFLTKPYKYFKIGATGVGIRLLYHFLKKQI